jgi:hypothetical protein
VVQWHFRVARYLHKQSQKPALSITLQPWRGGRYVPPKHQLTFTGLHDVISQRQNSSWPLLWESIIWQLSEVLTALAMRNYISWDATLCSQLKTNWLLPPFFGLKSKPSKKPARSRQQETSDFPNRLQSVTSQEIEPFSKSKFRELKTKCIHTCDKHVFQCIQFNTSLPRTTSKQWNSTSLTPKKMSIWQHTT